MGRYQGLIIPSHYLISRNLRSLSKTAVAVVKPVHSPFSDLAFTLMLHNSINNVISLYNHFHLEFLVHIPLIQASPISLNKQVKSTTKNIKDTHLRSIFSRHSIFWLRFTGFWIDHIPQETIVTSKRKLVKIFIDSSTLRLHMCHILLCNSIHQKTHSVVNIIPIKKRPKS